MRVIGDACIKCGSCASVCPVGAISEGEVKYPVNIRVYGVLSFSIYSNFRRFRYGCLTVAQPF